MHLSANLRFTSKPKPNYKVRLKLSTFLVLLLLSNHTFSKEKQASSESNSCQKLPNAPLTKLQSIEEIDQDLTIYADRVNYQPDAKLELKGKVEMIHGRYHAMSDTASIDQTKQKASLNGDIVLSSPDLILSGDTAEMSLVDDQVSVTNAVFSNPNTMINGEASKLTHPDKDTLIINDGLFTSCPPENRSWAFASEKITLDRELGFGHAKNTRFLINDTPVLYMPWFSFPIDDRRKSGFLYPTLGSSNTERGIFLSTPYYLDLAPEYDATITPSYIHNRGLHTEIEARHKSQFTNSNLALGFLDQDKYFDNERLSAGGTKQGSRWGLSFEQDISPFANGWHGKVKYSEVSDNDYLGDLNQGLNIDRKDYLDRRAQFHFSDDDWRLSILLQQFKSIDDDIEASEVAYQRLPEVTFDISESFKRFKFDWQSQYVYFYRNREDLIGEERSFGSRIRHNPSLSLPLYKSWGYLTPSFTLDHSDYFLQDYSPVDNHLSRTVPIYELDTGLFFDRPSYFEGKNIRHSLEPRLYYVYSEVSSQNDIPNFDSTLPSFYYQRLFSANRFSGGDRIGDNNRLTLGFTSRWTDLNDGVDKVSLSIGQIYHYADRQVSINGLGESDRSDSLLASELVLRPLPGLEFKMTGLWDAREQQTREGNAGIHFHTADYRSLINVSHRYIRHEIEQTDSSFITPITQSLSLIARWRYDLDNNRTIGSLAGVEYAGCCWRIQFLSQSYLSNDSEILNGLLFRFQLSGVGNFGQSTKNMDKQILGYSAREAQFQ